MLRRGKVRDQGLVSHGTGTNGVASAPARALEPSAPLVARGLLGELMVEAELVTEAQVTEALELQTAVTEAGSTPERIGRILVQQGVIAEADLVASLADQYGLAVVDLGKETPDTDAVALLKESIARDIIALPLREVDGTLVVATANPGHPNLRDLLERETGRNVEIRVASETDVIRSVNRVYKAVAAVGAAVRVFEAKVLDRGGTTVDETLEVDANAPVVQVVSMILQQAVRDRASDVHIEPMGERVRVRNRIDGALHEVLSLPQAMSQALVSRIKIMADMNIVERRRPQDGQIETIVDGNELDIRVSTTSTVHGEKTVLRILDKARALYDVAQLGMPADTSEMYQDIIRSPYGMVVCAGPTGSGKTTTLYATLMAINSEEINVMTVEDPVEYSFAEINQIGINEQAGVTFAAGLRSILRQDPDAILVGEIRDVETARIAIQAALTGHFVLSTIHATDATSALHRFLDMGIESFLLASSMLAVVGQRLVRQTCPECKVPYELSAEEAGFLERVGGTQKDSYIRGAGCTFCAGTGYQGRIGVYEVLRVTNEMRELIVHNAPVEQIRDLAVEQGMVSLRDQALRLVDDDVTTIAEVMRTIYIL
jgi:type IV pilus assembly protein PilB